MGFPIKMIGKYEFAYEVGYKFVWQGGAYIDVYRIGEQSAFDAINVWNYEKNAPRIKKSFDAFEAACMKYVGEMGREFVV